MSATARNELISPYFSFCPIIRVNGRTFPVEIFYLDDVHQIIQTGQLNQFESRQPPSNESSSSSPSLLKKLNKKKNINLTSHQNYLIPHVDEEKIAEFIIRLIQKENLEKSKQIFDESTTNSK